MSHRTSGWARSTNTRASATWVRYRGSSAGTPKYLIARRMTSGSMATASIRFDNGVLATLASTDDYGMAYDATILTTTGELRFVTNPWLPAAGDNILRWTPYDGEPETITVATDADAFLHQTRLVERCLAAGLTEAPRPSPRLRDSLEIMELLTEWEARCLAAVSS